MEEDGFQEKTPDQTEEGLSDEKKQLLNNVRVAKIPLDGVKGGFIDAPSGDFVGRDPMAFNINFVEGRSLRTENQVFKPLDANDVETIPGALQSATSVDHTSAQIAQIERLRGRVTRLIPTKEALDNLKELRQPSRLSTTTLLDFVFFLSPRWSPLKRYVANKNYDEPLDDGQYLTQLSKIENQISPNIGEDSLQELLRNLSRISDEVNIRISRLNSTFQSLLYPATTCGELVGHMTSKIGHKELREEGQMHQGIVSHLVSKLNSDKLLGKGFDVLSDEAQAAIGVMTEIEQRRVWVERLITLDRRKRNLTIFSVTAYIVVVIALMSLLYFRVGTRLQVGKQPLSTLKLPLFGIPWPVALWSLIGSIASMVYRFNRRPIYDFGDAIKWMLTRPFQGVVLGSAFYLVLVSGLFLLTGTPTTDASGSVRADEIILVLSFLVGFSDRFADTVFNTLVDKYSREDKKDGFDSENSPDSND